MNIVILAAGKGTRMHSDLPKVLHTLAGRPLLAHVLEQARALKPQRIVVIYGHGGDAVARALASDDLVWALQSPQRGTGHAVMQALPHLIDSVPTLVLYGDVPLTAAQSLATLVEPASQGALSILTVDLDDPTGYGRIVRDGGRVVRIVEHKDADSATRAIREVNTGILAAPTPALRRWLAGLSDNNAQGEYYLTDIVAAAVADGVVVEATQPAHDWETLGVNSRAQLAQLERIYQRTQADRLMEAGVALADPARLDIRGTLECGRDVFIDVGCVFEGQVRLAAGVTVGPYCVLRNVSLGERAQVLAFSHLDGAQVGADARVGPYARLRPGTELGEGSHVGNFVEMKATRLGAGSKANHLAYVGDAEV
ncbi:MAG: bifunctional UDP-N-acetylglucosamine diphosphorylase/glucosamine-1-phosphate N-acetyltransferase GlmU, partial [Betaproteobacteria bacterium]